MVKYIKFDENYQPIIEKDIPQKNLTAECWLIQINGLSECEKCPYKDKENCGGKEIRKTLKNKKGLSVPLWSE